MSTQWAPPQGFPAPRLGEVTEAMRLRAVTDMMKWQHQDVTVKFLIRSVLANWSQPSLGHLARYCPDEFDDMYEEASALVRNDL